MRVLRKMKAVVLLLALVALFVGAFTITTTSTVSARPSCCIWVMYCTVTPPIVCWEVCKPVPCPK